MLFDLRGRRKRMIQVIYATLAGLMAIGLVGFGIGSDASGGLFTCNYQQQSASADLVKRADELEAQAQQSPKKEGLWLELARARVQAGNAEAETDPQTGAQTFNAEGVEQFQEGADAWETYLDLKPKKPSPEVAVLIGQSYFAIAQNETDLNRAVGALEGAAEAQKVFADQRPSQGSLSQLATYHYLAGDFKAAKRAETRAVKEADPSERSLIKNQLKQSKEIGKQLKKQLQQLAKQQKQQPGGDPLENPLGGLGSSGGLQSGTP
jgi:hypothetical protein